jgi:hypothetical protein
MKLLYDKADFPNSRRLRDSRFTWLMELGARELAETGLDRCGTSSPDK